MVCFQEPLMHYTRNLSYLYQYYWFFALFFSVQSHLKGFIKIKWGKTKELKHWKKELRKEIEEKLPKPLVHQKMNFLKTKKKGMNKNTYLYIIRHESGMIPDIYIRNPILKHRINLPFCVNHTMIVYNTAVNSAVSRW